MSLLAASLAAIKSMFIDRCSSEPFHRTRDCNSIRLRFLRYANNQNKNTSIASLIAADVLEFDENRSKTKEKRRKRWIDILSKLALFIFIELYSSQRINKYKYMSEWCHSPMDFHPWKTVWMNRRFMHTYIHLYATMTLSCSGIPFHSQFHPEFRWNTGIDSHLSSTL